MISFSRRPWFVPALFGVAVCFTHLHQGTLAVDAVKYAHIARDILLRNDWLNLFDRYEQAPYVNKPHLLFWLVAFNFQLFGFSTFVAKAPAAAFAFVSILLLWDLTKRLFDLRCALIAVLLLVLNRAFMRDVVDLSFDGMALCGALLLFRSGILFFQEPRLRDSFLHWFLAGLGVFFLFQSKIPYLAFVLFPLGANAVLEGSLGRLLRARAVWLGLLPWVALSLSWFAVVGRNTVSGALDNQFIAPFVYASRTEGVLLRWLDAVFISYAPVSWLAVIFLIIRVRSSEPLPMPRWVKQLLILWVLPALPMILFASARPRYLLVPMLSVILYAAFEIGRRVPNAQFLVYERRLFAFSLLLGVLLALSPIPLHRADPVLLQIRARPELLDQASLVCVEGRGDKRTASTVKNTELLIFLETGRNIPVYDSKRLLETAPSERTVLVNNLCLSELKSQGLRFEEAFHSPTASVITLL